jgi:hypothetical protein
MSIVWGITSIHEDRFCPIFKWFAFPHYFTLAVMFYYKICGDICHLPYYSKSRRINELCSFTEYFKRKSSAIRHVKIGKILKLLNPNINEYQKQKNNVSGEFRAAGAEGRQPYRHLWADCLDNVGTLTSHNPIGLHGLLLEHGLQIWISTQVWRLFVL